MFDHIMMYDGGVVESISTIWGFVKTFFFKLWLMWATQKR